MHSTQTAIKEIPLCSIQKLIIISHINKQSYACRLDKNRIRKIEYNEMYKNCTRNITCERKNSLHLSLY